MILKDLFDDYQLSNFDSKCYSRAYQKDTSHSAYVATATESVGVKIDGLLPPNFL